MFVEEVFQIEGKVVVVTGGTGVLGTSMCKALAKAGARVVIVGRRKEAGDALAAQIIAAGGTALSVTADVLQEEQLVQARDIILQKFTTIDILVNAAGGNMPGAIITPEKTFLDLNIADFQKVLDLNITGTVLPSQIFGSVMVQHKKGNIINISSMTADRPLTRVAGYSAAKAAISNFTQWLSVEMARKFGEGIRVNAIAPGFFLTEQNRTLLTNSDGTLTARGQSIVANTPFARFGEPDELIGTLLWLCSDASRFVTGVVVPVDGGFSAFAGV